MLKINFIRRSFRFDGGAEVAANSFINALSELGELQLICESWSGDLLNRIGLHELSVQGFTRAKRYSNFIHKASMLASSHNAITHSHEWVPGSDVLRLGDGLHSEWLDLIDMPKYKKLLDPFHRTKLRLEKESLEHNNLKVVITNSEMIKASLIDRYNLEESNIRVVRNILTNEYINHEPNENARDPFKLIFVGSGWHRKGLIFALRMLSFLPEEWTLDIIGNDSNCVSYIDNAKQLNISHRVNFLGAVKVTPEFYARASILIHPAIYEPFPNVAMEALSQGAGIVTTHNCGASDFGSEFGVWSCDREPEALAWLVREAAKSLNLNRLKIMNNFRKYNASYLVNELKDIYSIFK